MNTCIFIKKQILIDFLNYLFQEKENNALKISTTKDVGKFLVSRVSYSDIPVLKENNKNLVPIVLPKNAFISCEKKFCYYTKEDTEKINYELEATFNIDFDRFYLEGQKLKMNQKEIISSYIFSRNLESLEGDIETLKKRKYREEVKKFEILNQYFKNKSYYRSKLIEKSILNETLYIC